MLNRDERVQYSMGPQPLTVDRDELHQTLADDTCRKTISRLETHENSALALDELVTGTRMGAATEARPSAANLHHVILPKLAAADILEYDSSSRTVHYESQERVKTALATSEGISQ